MTPDFTPVTVVGTKVWSADARRNTYADQYVIIKHKVED
jgi:hypothetical protein